MANNENTKLLVYRSSLTSCYHKDGGSSICYFGGSFILFQSCGTKSKATEYSEGTFLYSYSVENKNLHQFLKESTISDCGEKGKGQSTNYLYHGNQTISSTNISKNLGRAEAAFESDFPNSLHITFCTSEQNEVSNKDCHHISGSIPFSIKRCNFIQNRCGDSIFYSDPQVIFDECYLFGNTYGKEFYQNTAILYKSYYDGNTTKVSILIPTDNIINEIHHFSFGSCDAEFPLIKDINQNCNYRSYNCKFDATIIKVLSYSLSILTLKK